MFERAQLPQKAGSRAADARGTGSVRPTTAPTRRPRAATPPGSGHTGPTRTPGVDHRALLFRAVGVPDAVVDKVGAAAWLTLTGAGLEEHERFETLLRCLHDGTAALLVDDLVARLEAGEFDALFVGRPGSTVDELARQISAATLEHLKVEPWKGREIPINKPLCRDVCTWIVTQVVAYVAAHPFGSA